MKDVLETLQKLPPKCAAIVFGQPRTILRGANQMGMFVGDQHTVDQWNLSQGISPEQVQAMIVGVTLGWDKDGADPDTHAADLGNRPGPFDYTYVGTVDVRITVSAPTEAVAAQKAQAEREQLIIHMIGRGYCDDEGPITGFAAGDTFDLVESTDPQT